MFTNTAQPAADYTPGVSADRRQVRRQRVLKSGSMRFNSGYASYQCSIKNMSEAGALLLMGETSGLPSEFDFVIKDDPTKRRAKLIWRGRETVGISFIEA